MPAKWENWPARWLHIQKVLERPGPFAHVTFEHDSKLLPLIQENCKVLVIGAGGLGCELLKDLALMGFTNIDVIDMDIIDLSNLNRQFLFRHKDIGKPKADIAAAFINRRVPGCCVTPHFKKIQEFQQDYYKEFDIVVCGLDSIVARRWINGMLISLLQYDDEGVLDESTIVPLVDGGTEGFKGNARVCMPGKSACIECTLDLYPPQVNFPMCTIANTPRLPQHCIEWVRIIHWAKVRPFGDDIEIDGDDPIHILWIFDESLKRSNEFNIPGVTYRLTQGVVKHIIPAVASTNAVIASVCAAEVFKIATGCCQTLNNYTIFNDSESVYTYSYEAEKNENCPACGDIPPNLHFSSSHKLSTVTDYLKDNPNFLFKAPALITSINGEDVTLYIESIENMEKMLHHNLNKTLSELGLVNGQEIIVADATSPKSKKFILYYTDNQMDMDE